MVLDNSRLCLENKFLENKSCRIFRFRPVYFKKSCQEIWERVNQPLYLLYITSEVKQYYEALFLSYRPQTKCSISQFFKTNCTHSIFRTIEASVGSYRNPFKSIKSNQSINIQNRRGTSGLLAKPVQKISKITYTATGSHF